MLIGGPHKYRVVVAINDITTNVQTSEEKDVGLRQLTALFLQGMATVRENGVTIQALIRESEFQGEAKWQFKRGSLAFKPFPDKPAQLARWIPLRFEADGSRTLAWWAWCPWWQFVGHQWRWLPVARLWWIVRDEPIRSKTERASSPRPRFYRKTSRRIEARSPKIADELATQHPQCINEFNINAAFASECLGRLAFEFALSVVKSETLDMFDKRKFLHILHRVSRGFSESDVNALWREYSALGAVFAHRKVVVTLSLPDCPLLNIGKLEQIQFIQWTESLAKQFTPMHSAFALTM